MKRAERTYSGTKNPAVSDRERENREIARKAAEGGIVLLKNDGCLPIQKGEKIALFGGGAVCTVKGGTGSGDVNEREVVSIYQGMVNHGIPITSQRWLDSFRKIYEEERNAWREKILMETRREKGEDLLKIYAAHPFQMPGGDPIEAEDLKGAETAVYVISRVAGEAADRFAGEGDYYLTEREKEDLRILSGNSGKLLVILNTGGQMDLKEILALPNLKGLISLVQPGMEGGNALAGILTGEVTPSGKLTDTWAKNYEDYPNSAFFSHNNGNVEKEEYREGLFVGYRYFDSFGVEPEFPFGFGLSYTDFSIGQTEVLTEENQITVNTVVKNTGDTYAGREVVQIYASCPQGKTFREYRRLVAFGKTKLLKPGESTCLSLTFPVKGLAGFDEETSAWVLEKGFYYLWIGNSIARLSLAGALVSGEKVVLERVKPICPLKEELEELEPPKERLFNLREAAKREAEEKGMTALPLLVGEEEPAKEQKKTEFLERAEALVKKLSVEELISMVIGEVSKGQNNSLGAAGIMVPGAAGETGSALEETWDVPGISMADGPAGVRLMKSYEVDRDTGHVYSQGILGALEGGFFADREKHENTDTYYQYCTAIPVGTLLAQTFDPELLESVGRAVARELQEFGVAWWLAPGMNIHRNPLCGRNYEYYSEDPVVSGVMGAAITRGVQSVPGVGTTIKHFACNNQEDNRKGSDSILTERTLRELYLRGFEIAVKSSEPMAMMTSYNLINGVHAANSFDLCTVAAREEWDFQGIIMTDWTTTMWGGGSIPFQCVKAGNDLIMPGAETDRENIRVALKQGELKREELEACVKRLLAVIYQTLGYEGSTSYLSRFPDRSPYLTIKEGES